MRRKLAKNEEMAIRAVSIEVAEEPPYRTRTGPVDVWATSRRCRGVVQTGLKKWMELQLHPERIREDPLLEKRLQPLETLRVSPLEIWQRYPRQQKILAVLNGKPVLPDDPILRPRRR